MKQKLLTLLLFVMAIYIIFFGGGDIIDTSSSTAPSGAQISDISDIGFVYDQLDVKPDVKP